MKPQKRMRQASPALAARRRQYAKLNKEFAELPENRWCPVAAAGLILSDCKFIGVAHYFEEHEGETCENCLHCGKTIEQCRRRKLLATDTHHKGGREGKLLLDFSKCIRVSREGHRWIEQHPNEARRRGWLI
jgi:hypothetical protein